MAGEHAVPWELVPFERLGPVRFDASREEVLALVGEPKFRHTGQGEDGEWLPDEDNYPAFSIEYDRDDHVLGVSCKSMQPVTYQGWLLTGLHNTAIREWAEGHGLTTRWSKFHRTLLIPELVLSFWIPEVDYAPPGTAVIVGAARQDYWELVAEPQDP
jgi:hypothetical protein